MTEEHSGECSMDGEWSRKPCRVAICVQRLVHSVGRKSACLVDRRVLGPLGRGRLVVLLFGSVLTLVKKDCSFLQSSCHTLKKKKVQILYPELETRSLLLVTLIGRLSRKI